MGSLLDSDLRQPARSKWAPSPVGAVEGLRGGTTATLLVKRGEGWEYGDEIQIQVSLNELEYAALPGGDSLFWSGIEVRLDKKDLPENRRYYLTAALLPPSFLWYAHAPLLPGRGPKASSRMDSLRKLEKGAIRFPRLPFDPFEHDGRCLVARLGDLRRPHWMGKHGRNAGDGFLVVRSPNRKSNKKKREWMFGLCPVPPDRIVMAMVQRMQGVLESEFSGSVKPHRRPQQLDWRDEQELLSIDQPSPGVDLAQVSLAAAVRQSLGRRGGSAVRLEQRIRWEFQNHFRDAVKRTNREPRREVRARLEAAYAGFIKEHPDCDRLRRNGRLDLTLLHAAARLPDPEAQRCRELFLQIIGRR